MLIFELKSTISCPQNSTTQVMLSSLQDLYKMTLFGKAILCGLETQNYLWKISLNLVASSWNMIPCFSRECLGLYFQFVNAFFLINILAQNSSILMQILVEPLWQVCLTRTLKTEKALFWSKLSQSFYVRSRNLASFTQVFKSQVWMEWICSMAIWVVKFSREGYKIRDRFSVKNERTYFNGIILFCVQPHCRLIKNWASI